LQGELKVRELERFKACYCGLCHALGRKYGAASRLMLNYELVFLAMLLWGEDEPVALERRRCVSSPFLKRRCCARNPALDASAGYHVILSWWKLRDTIADEPFIKAMPYRLLSVLLSRAYRKAAREHSGFDAKVRAEIAALAEYEAQAGESLDCAADKFAQILKAAAPEGLPEGTRRPLEELLYHLGRWIYIIDACDDYRADVRAGRYNPVAAICPPQDGALPKESESRMKTTLTHSNNLLRAAFELLPENAWSHIVSNIVYLSMPDTCDRVFEGSWDRRSRELKAGS